MAAIDQQALVEAVAGVERQAELAVEAARRGPGGSGGVGARYVFHYDSRTLSELDSVATPRPAAGPVCTDQGDLS